MASAKECVILMHNEPQVNASFAFAEAISALAIAFSIKKKKELLLKGILSLIKALYHMLEHLFQLRIRMIRPCFDEVISEPISEPLIELLQYFAQTNGVHFNKKEEP